MFFWTLSVIASTEPWLQADRVVHREHAEPADGPVPAQGHRQVHRGAVAQDRHLHGLIRTLGNGFAEMPVERHRAAVDRHDHVSRLEPGAIAWFVRRDRSQSRVHVRQHTDVANLEPALARQQRRCDGPALLQPVAEQADRNLAVRFRSDRHQELIPVVHAAARDGHNPIARSDVGLRRHRSFRHHADNHRLVLVGLALEALMEHDGGQHDGEEEVHDRSHDQDLESLPLRFGQELVGPDDCAALFVALDVLRVLAGHLDVAAERKGADAVLGVAAPEARNRRIEAQLELQDPDAHTLGGEKMSQFVDENEHAKHEDKCQKCNHSINLRPLILTRGQSPGHVRGPRNRPREPAPE